MQPLTSIAEALRTWVGSAGDLLRSNFTSKHRVTYKSEKNIVTEMDRRVEQLFLRNIRRKFPDHLILSEEQAEKANRPWTMKTPAQFCWIIDPLDGTTNYAHGFPHFSVSAGVAYAGQVLLGAVYNPILKEFYFAQRGKSAWCNQRRIRVSTTQSVQHALLATGFPYNLRTGQENNFSAFYLMCLKSQAVRRPGSASLDLCDVACGRFDGFWEYQLKPWDVAAGALIVEEAGGKITNRFSTWKNPLAVGEGVFIASNGRLHARMTALLKNAETWRRGFNFTSARKINLPPKEKNRC